MRFSAGTLALMASAFGLCTCLVGRLLSTRLASGEHQTPPSKTLSHRKALSRKWGDVEERVGAQANAAGLEIAEIEWIRARARESATVAAGGGSSSSGGCPGEGAVLVVRLSLLNALEVGINSRSRWAMEPVAVQERLKLRLRLALADLLSSNAGYRVQANLRSSHHADGALRTAAAPQEGSVIKVSEGR